MKANDITVTQLVNVTMGEFWVEEEGAGEDIPLTVSHTLDHG